MTTLTDSEVVKIAVDLCTRDKLKKKILNPSLRQTEHFEKDYWDDAVEKEAFRLLRALPCFSLEPEEKERVVGAVFSIALRMLTWTEYQMGIFNFSHEFCFNFLKKDLFTAEGILDDEKMVEKLLSSDLTNKQAFQVACFYCLKDRIGPTFSSLTKKEKALFYDAENPVRVKQLTLIKFWTYYLMGDIDKLRRDKSIDQYRLRCAINSGSKMAVGFCTQRTGLVKRKNYIVDAGVEVIKFRIIREVRTRTRGNIVDDSVAFRSDSYDPSEEFFTPNCLLADIFYFLLSKMTDDQKGEMIRKFYEWCKDYKIISDCPAHIRCYEYFLYWPYQRRFMDFVKYTLPYLREKSYGSILLDICSRIEPDKGTLWYRENSFCDYRKVLVEFWNLASEEVIRYIFREKSASFDVENHERQNLTYSEGKEMVYHLFLHENFTLEDKNIVKRILDRLNSFERRELLDSSAGVLICNILIDKEEFELFDEFVFMCLRNREETLAFREKRTYMAVQEKCYDFILKDKWDEAVEFMKWSYISEADMVGFKRGLIWRDRGKEVCLELFLSNVACANRFINWSLPVSESAELFKCSLITDIRGITFCRNRIVAGKLDVLDRFIRWCFSADDQARNFKSKLIDKYGFSILTKILFGIEDNESDNASGHKNVFTLADEFLSWCFPRKSDEVIYKKDYFKQYGTSIYSEFIQAYKCFEVAPFFTWIGLPSEEIRRLRKSVLFTCTTTCDLFDDMMASEENDERFAECGGRQKAIEQLLKWCLIDKEAVIEFKARYRCYKNDPVVRRLVRQLRDKFDDEEDGEKRHENFKSRVFLLK